MQILDLILLFVGGLILFALVAVARIWFTRLITGKYFGSYSTGGSVTNFPETMREDSDEKNE